MLEGQVRPCGQLTQPNIGLRLKLGEDGDQSHPTTPAPHEPRRAFPTRRPHDAGALQLVDGDRTSTHENTEHGVSACMRLPHSPHHLRRQHSRACTLVRTLNDAMPSWHGAQRRRRMGDILLRAALRRGGRAMALPRPVCPRIPVLLRVAILLCAWLVQEGAHLLVRYLFSAVELGVKAVIPREIIGGIPGMVVGAFVFLLVHGVHGDGAEDEH
jgi:hypothetical protein